MRHKTRISVHRNKYGRPEITVSVPISPDTEGTSWGIGGVSLGSDGDIDTLIAKLAAFRDDKDSPAIDEEHRGVSPLT